MLRRLQLRTRRGYAWVPIGAGLALYAMLGVGPDADTYAHLFGLGIGTAVGLGAAYAQISRGWRPPRPVVQVLIGAATVGAVVLRLVGRVSRRPLRPAAGRARAQERGAASARLSGARSPAHGISARAVGRAHGSKTVNVAPSSGWESTLTVPPSASTILCTLHNPRPTPP